MNLAILGHSAICVQENETEGIKLGNRDHC